MGVFSSPEAIFERSPEDFQTLEGIGTAHIQLIKSWKNYSDTRIQGRRKPS